MLPEFCFLFFSCPVSEACSKNVVIMLVKRLASCSEIVTQRCFVKKLLLQILQNRETTCTRVCFLIKMQAEARVFPCEFSKILRTSFYVEQLRWLLLPCCLVVEIITFIPARCVSRILTTRKYLKWRALQ